MQSILILTLVAIGLVAVGQAVILLRVMRGQQQLASNYDEIVRYLEDVGTLLGGVSRALSQGQPGPPAALPVGTPAPAFVLPDLAGRERKLEEFLGKPLVLTFFSTTCGFCQKMAPRIGTLPESAPRMLVVSRGDVDQHLQLAAENKWRCDVLLESGNEVMAAYRATGTPTGYLIDAEGRIASDLAVGADALFALVYGATGGSDGNDLTAETLRKKEAEAVERAREAGLAVTTSTLRRDGLPIGTPAPDFALADLDGKKRKLADFRDKRVLLVFSDPNCGPCDALAPELARLQRSHGSNNLQVLMVSRGDVEENRKKAAQHGYTFPVLLQKRWEVSKDYAMFATPVGYLINEKGIIAKEVAVGRSAILCLV